MLCFLVNGEVVKVTVKAEKQYGLAIQLLRKQNGMTRLELTDKTGLVSGTLRRIERNEMTTERGLHLHELAEAFGVTVDDIEALANTVTQKDLDEYELVPVQKIQPFPKRESEDFNQRLKTILNSSSVSTLITDLRDLYGVTFEELSKRSGVVEPRLKKLESGEEEPRLDARVRLGKVFELRPDMFNTRHPYRNQAPILYKKIRACALALNLTPRQLADKALGSADYIKSLDDPFVVPNIQSIERLASAIGISPKTLGDTSLSVNETVEQISGPREATKKYVLDAWEADPDEAYPAVPGATEPPKSAPKTDQSETTNEVPTKTKSKPVKSTPTKTETNHPTKKLVEAQAINTMQTLFSFENFGEADYKELMDTFELLFQTAKK